MCSYGDRAVTGLGQQSVVEKHEGALCFSLFQGSELGVRERLAHVGLAGGRRLERGPLSLTGSRQKVKLILVLKEKY